MTTLESLSAAWLELKEQERKAVEARRAVEDSIRDLLRLAPDYIGSARAGAVKLTCGTTTKVDKDEAVRIAEESGKLAELQSLFRWKPELDKKAWDSADTETKQLFSRAIITAPSRATFEAIKETKK